VIKVKGKTYFRSVRGADSDAKFPPVCYFRATKEEKS